MASFLLSLAVGAPLAQRLEDLTQVITFQLIDGQILRSRGIGRGAGAVVELVAPGRDDARSSTHLTQVDVVVELVVLGLAFRTDRIRLHHHDAFGHVAPPQSES